jgi:tRNA G10  N-methylase Trm11
MKWFFILGRNPKLSREEVLSYLRSREREHKEIFFEENFLVLETREGELFDIQEFGGVIKLGKIDFEGKMNDFNLYVEKNEIIPSDKFSYAVFGNQEFEVLKNRFKSYKKKAMLKHGRKRIVFQDGEKQEFPHAEFNLFLYNFKGQIYFGSATQDYNVSKIKERDMKKPVRREYLAISPRLAKILINLSGAKPQGLMLDPFCGIGGILQEALLKRINVYGIDKSAQAIKDADENLKWLFGQYKIKNTYKLENLDSRKSPDMQFSAVATETPLGKVVKKKQDDNEAKQIIQNFEAFMIPILGRIKKVKKPKAKIAITFPAIRDFRVDSKKIANKTGLKIVIDPILESRPDQFISREIVVFE